MGIEIPRRQMLIFTCCHPPINQDAQIALTLNTLGGLSVPEVARAFLVPTPTMAPPAAGALELAGNASQKKFLRRKLAVLASPSSDVL